MKKHVASVLILIVAMGLVGCSSLRPLTSKPPASVISLATTHVNKQWFGNSTILPAGDYRATLEDDRGYYYAAPMRIIRNDTIGWQYDGGLYLPKGATVPTHYYIVGRHHATGLCRLKAPPQVELKP